MLDSIRRFFGYWDSRGLHYSVEHLREVAPTIAFAPLEIQAKYVDQVCTLSINNIGFIKKQMMHIDQGYTWKTMQIEMLQKKISLFNTTAIGNMAYIALHCPDQCCRDKALHFLNVYNHLLTLKKYS